MRKMRRRSTRKMRKTMMEKVCKTVCVGGAGGQGDSSGREC